MMSQPVWRSLEAFIGRPINFQVETYYTQEQYDIVLL